MSGLSENGQELETATDRELLDRFVAQRDQRAFELLVERHGPLVWSVCRRVLRCYHDQEDVFQATFVKLLVYAKQTGWHETVGGWLHKVAFRMAIDRRAEQKRRRETELIEISAAERGVFAAIEQQEHELALHAAILQLPRKYREAVVLCCLQQKSTQEAAAEIGCTPTILKGRLQRGRRQLIRLLRPCGLSLSFAIVMFERTVQAALPLQLKEAATLAGLSHFDGCGTAPLSSQATHLRRGDLGFMKVEFTEATTKAAFVAVGGAAVFWLGIAAILGSIPSGASALAAPPLAHHVEIVSPATNAEVRSPGGQVPPPPDAAADATHDDQDPEFSDAEAISRSINNLKQINLALLNYESAKKEFPSRATYTLEGTAIKDADKEAKPLLSWRVQILGFLNESPLYQKFRHDEPWDSEHNKKLIAEMPDVFRSPNSKAKPGRTGYVVPVTEGSLFEKLTRGRQMREMRDGTSRTVMVVEVDDDSAPIWTKPDDWEVDPKQPSKGLLFRQGKAALGFADGYADAFDKTKLTAEQLMKIFTCNGSEVVDLDDLK